MESVKVDLSKLLQKHGSYLAIVSYYGFNDEASFMVRSLSKGMYEIAKNWDNMLNQCTRRKTIYLRDNNARAIGKHLERRDTKLFNFDIEIRRNEGIEVLSRFMFYLKGLKAQDEEKYIKAKEANDPKARHKLFFVAENYLNIANIHPVTIKFNKII